MPCRGKDSVGEGEGGEGITGRHLMGTDVSSLFTITIRAMQDTSSNFAERSDV